MFASIFRKNNNSVNLIRSVTNTIRKRFGFCLLSKSSSSSIASPKPSIYKLKLPYYNVRSFSEITDNEDNSEEEEEKPFNFAKNNITIPFYCSLYSLSDLLGCDLVELHEKYNNLIESEIKEVNEYLNNDDLELFLLEHNINYKFEPHESVKTQRAMVVTIMGHVDHGKTTLLDKIRNSNIVDSEYGEITQSIGAFLVKAKLSDTKITFIDTPGHEVFGQMRQRGAKITDCIIIVVSASEGIQKQTVEVINIAKAVKAKILIVVNKIDLPKAEPDRVLEELALEGINTTKFGGDIPYVLISAKNNINIDQVEKALVEISKTIDLEEELNI